MIRFHSADPPFASIRVHRSMAFLLSGLMLSLIVLQSGRALAGSTSATTQSLSRIARLAVAPFAGEKEALAIAHALVDELSRTSIERLIAPGDFVATRTFEPRAADIRRWAYNSAVDAIVVGRVYLTGKDAKQTRFIEAVIRSGHSGAALSRHAVSSRFGDSYQQAIAELALLISGDLGLLPESRDETPDDRRSAKATDADPPQTSEGSEAKGLASDFSTSGFRKDAPIEISAEVAEIISRNDGRRLIFQRNVHVRQANVSLRSDRLVAFYQKGESEPRELQAEGNVRIVQDDRRASCDRATYLRKASRLVCRGHAEMVQGCDIVRGESIEFDLAGQHAVITGAASIVIEPEGDGGSACIVDEGQL
jgi:lipopolysaccharide export system protein LptA